MIFKSRISGSKMVDQEIMTKENFSVPNDLCHPLGWSAKDDFTDLFELDHLPVKEFLRDILKFNKKCLSVKKENTKEDHTQKCDNLSDIISELLKSSTEEYKGTPAAKEIRHLEMAYKSNMEKFLMKMDEFMEYVRNMQSKLLKSLREFQGISRGTAGIILGSSIANFAVMIGSLVHKFFRFSWNSKILLIPTLTGALTFTTSLLSFTYMSQTTRDFSKDLSKETRLLRELIAVHQKGDWLDEEVSKLFPYGININLTDFENVNNLKMRPLLKTYLCSKIIMSNVERDKELLENENFLMKVKLFVESPAAEIWWSRMKIKKLLQEIRQKSNESSARQFLSGHENVIYRTTLYVYPVIIPWLFVSRAPEEMKFIFATLAGFISALEFTEDGSEELDDLKRMYRNFEKHFLEIHKICEMLDDNEY